MDSSSFKGQMLRVSETSLRYQCCGTGIGIPRTGNRKSVCVSPRPVGARKTRKTGLGGAWRVGSLVSIIIIVRRRPVPAPLFFFSLSFLPSPPLFPRTGERRPFSTHVTCARSTRHSSYAVCICTRLFRRYEFKCEQRGRGASATSLVVPPASLPRGSERDPLPEEEIFGTKRFSFLCGIVALILLLLFFFLFVKLERVCIKCSSSEGDQSLGERIIVNCFR